MVNGHQQFSLRGGLPLERPVFLSSPYPTRFGSAVAPLGLTTEQRVTFLWASMVCGMIWAFYLLVASHGVLHNDAIAHFRFSRGAWHDPSLILNHWGRPVDTLLYMVPARFGLLWARLTTLALAALTVLVTFRLARQLGVGYAFAVPLLLWFQPWFLTWAVHPSMTEIPFSLMMVLAASLFVSNQTVLASAVIGLFPLIRVEALALTALWVAFCAWRRAWRGVVAASLPVVVYGALFWAVFGHLPEGDMPLNPIVVFTHHVVHPDEIAPPWRIYRWLSYPRFLALGCGVPLTALALYGIPRLMALPAGLAVVAWYGTYAALHVALLRLGIKAHAEARYLLPLASLVSIAGAMGFESLAERIRIWFPRSGGRKMFAQPGNLVLASVVTVIAASGLLVSPVPASPAQEAAQAAAAWLSQARQSDTPVLISCANVWFDYYYRGPTVITCDGPPPLVDRPAGTLAAWESEVSDNHGLPWAALSSDRAWHILKTFEVNKSRVVVFRKGPPRAGLP